MADIRHTLIWLFVLAALLCLALPAHGESRWYRVELLIFKQPPGAGAEHWQPLPQLDYPERYRFLIGPEQLAALEAGGEIDRLGRVVLRAAGSGEPAEAANAPGETPIDFVLQPRSDLELRGKAAYMERAGGYDVLFHESWVQPVGGKRHSRPIVIDRSGDGVGWPQLQGTINIHLSRYLHVETNLWLNTQGEYLPGSWRMPAPPRGPASTLDLREAQAVPEENPEPPAESEAEPVSDYPYRHAVLMQQNRKMRSREINYLDHPMLGLVILFTPVEWDEGAEPSAEDIRAAVTPEP